MCWGFGGAHGRLYRPPPSWPRASSRSGATHVRQKAVCPPPHQQCLRGPPPPISSAVRVTQLAFGKHWHLTTIFAFPPRITSEVEYLFPYMLAFQIFGSLKVPVGSRSPLSFSPVCQSRVCSRHDRPTPGRSPVVNIVRPVAHLSTLSLLPCPTAFLLTEPQPGSKAPQGLHRAQALISGIPSRPEGQFYSSHRTSSPLFFNPSTFTVPVVGGTRK